jgi:hypothetical protein
MEYFTPKKIIVHEKNRVVSIRGRNIRSPFDHIVRSKDRYDFLLKQLQLLSISDYSIEDVIKTRGAKSLKKERAKKVNTPIKKTVKKTESTSMLDKLAEEDIE